MTTDERDTRKRLLINRHIAKMTPEEIARRFMMHDLLRAAVMPKSRGKDEEKPPN